MLTRPHIDYRSAELIGFSSVSLQTDDRDSLIGEVVGSYRIASRIGAGGMGVVYRAEHVLLGRRAAVKVLLPERSANPEILERFFNEAKAASLIQHPGIVDIFDYGQLDDGNAYIVMEYLEGETLGDRLKREGQLGAAQAASIARHIAGTLAAAHEHGIIHRDLKPDNVFLVPDPAMPRGERAKLLDFGIAKLQTTTGDLIKTETGRLMGTPYYMSPEQCRGAGKVDHRTDIYSLGCVLYQILTGRPPFVLEGAGEILAAHIYEQAKPPRKLEPSIPVALEKVVMRLIEKELTRRYQTMHEVVAALNEVVPRFSGEEEPEPSLAVSSQLQTQRTPKLSRFSSDAETLDSEEQSYAHIEVERPGRWRWLAWTLPPALTVAAILTWVLWPEGEPPAVDDPAVVASGAPDAAATAPSPAPSPAPAAKPAPSAPSSPSPAKPSAAPAGSPDGAAKPNP
jgi:serine/threonine-protein kinase